MIEITESQIDSYALRGLIVQGETGSDVISFKLDPSLTGYSWRVRGTINGNSTESSAITPVESASYVKVDWTVTEDFTATAGMLYLTIVGTKDNGDIITKAIGSVEVVPDMTMQSAGTVTQNLFEQLVSRCNGYSEDAEAYATGKRGGEDVPSSDPAYHNNAYWYAQQTNPTNYATLTNKPSINGETLSGDMTADDFGLLSDPTQKSNGQVLTYNGSAWVAADPAPVPVSSVNGKTGAIVIDKALSCELSTSGWTQSGAVYNKAITVQGVTTTGTLVVSPDPSDYDAWVSSRIRATAQSANSITFTCSSVPSSALTANILLVEAVTE